MKNSFTFSQIQVLRVAFMSLSSVSIIWLWQSKSRGVLRRRSNRFKLLSIFHRVFRIRNYDNGANPFLAYFKIILLQAFIYFILNQIIASLIIIVSRLPTTKYHYPSIESNLCRCYFSLFNKRKFVDRQ